MHSAAAAALMMDASDEEEDEVESLLRLHDLEASAAAAADNWIYLGAHWKVMPPSRDGAILQSTSTTLVSALKFLVALKVEASED